MGNNSSRTRTARLCSRLAVIVMALCLVLTAVPFIAQDALPQADAATVDYTPATTATTADINSQLAAYPAGTVVNMTLAADIDFTVNGDKLTSTITGIEIPAGITVNLYLNGKNIKYMKDGGGAWQAPGIYGIVNHGTLNVYSGAGPQSPNRSTPSSTESTITMVNYRQMGGQDSRFEMAYSRLEAIQNEGVLSVNKNVTISLNTRLYYDDATGNKSATTTCVATGIYNKNASASAYINGAVINILTGADSVNDNGIIGGVTSGEARSIAYGVYGGDVRVDSSAVFSCDSYALNKENGSKQDYGKGRVICIAYGIVTDGDISVNGGTFSYKTTTADDNNGLNKGTQRVYQGGIFYKTGSVLTMTDGTITVPESNSFGYSNGTRLMYEAPIAVSTELPASAYQLFEVDKFSTDYGSEGYGRAYYPKGEIKAGQYKDEAGNIYNTSMSTTDGTHPTAIIRGAAEGSYRVHIVYRYWTNTNKDTLDSSIVSSSGTNGFSYMPLSDGTDVVNNKVQLSGLQSSTQYVKNADSAIKYVSGAEPCNPYYWQLYNLAYSMKSADWFSDVNVGASVHKGTPFRNFSATGAIDNSVAGGVSAPVYIFVDYYRLEPVGIKAEAGTANVATTDYTGYNIKASDIGLKIKDSVYETDYTADYNIDFADSSKMTVSYSYTGTTDAGVAVNGSGALPKDAGTYQVTLSVPQCTEYSKDPTLNKNRLALEYTFTLIIRPAEVNRGTLPESIAITYGEKLNEKLALSSFTATGILNENVPGVFSFTNAADGNTFKDAGEGTVSITWTPTYTGAVQVKNYKQTEFTLSYSAAKALLTISPNAAAVVYGNSEFTAPYSVSFAGLAGNDDNDTVRSALSAVMEYMINVNGGYVPYNAGETGAGEYAIRAAITDTSLPVLKNYEYTYNYGDSNPAGKLTVSKRDIVVTASAVSRPYAPDDYSVNVTFEVTGGKLGTDDVRVASTVGTLGENGAGTRDVGGIYGSTAAANLTGGAAANYRISELLFISGEKLTVEITKAAPTVSTPVVADMFYQRSRTLADVALTGASSSVEGTWQWLDRSVNPTVAQNKYAAKFVPADSANYEEKTADITINVKPTPVVISYSGTVSYGDNVPNITAYSYTAEQDPSFSIDAVTTSGNITPYTEYVKGSPVNSEGYAVQIVAPNFVDVNGNYSFTTADGVIRVKPRNIVYTVQNAAISYGENFIATASTVNLSFDESQLVGDDTPESITSNGAAPSFNFSTDYSFTGNYAVGTYAIRAAAAFTPSANYTVSVVNGTLTVNKAELTIKANNRTLAYNSDIPSNLSTSYQLIGAKKNETLAVMVSSGEVKFTTAYYKGAPVNAEGYPVSVDISDAVFNNYNVKTENGIITVIKATPVITAYPTASITFGQSLADAVFTGGEVQEGVAGKFAYTSGATVPAYSENPWLIYSASFIPEDTKNYNVVAIDSIALTVNKRPVSGSLAVSGVPMKGETLTADVSGMDPAEAGAYIYEWLIDGAVAATGDSLALNDSHVGKVITLRATAQGYYTGSQEYVVTAVAPQLTHISTIINAEEYSNYFTLSGITAFGGTTTVMYDAMPHGADFIQLASTLSAHKVGDITVKYNGSSVIPTKAGTYAVTIDVATPSYNSLHIDAAGKTVDENGAVVYSPVSNLHIGYLVIEKAPYNVVVTVADKVYDGYNTAEAADIAESGAAVLAGGVKDDVYFDASALTLLFSDANVGTGKTAAVANAALAGGSAANYELVLTLADSGRADITPRTLKAKVVPISREYEDGNFSVDLTFEVNAASIAPADTSSHAYVNEAAAAGAIDDCHAGMRAVTVSNAALAGTKAANYVLELTNLDGLSVMIEKAMPSYPLPDTGTLYYDAGRTLSGISLGDSRWSWDPAAANEVPGAGVHTYKAIYTPADTANFATVEYDVPLEVRKTNVVVKAASFSIIYGEGEPTYYYTATGLTGSDTVKNSIDGYVLMNCSYAPGSDVGTYSVVLSGHFESDNYSFTYVNGSVTVNKRAAYVTAIAENRQYEKDNLNVNVSFSALSNIYAGDSSNVYLDGIFPITGTVDTDTAGTKAVSYTAPVLAGSKANNYELKILNSKLTVEIEKALIPGVILPTTATVGFGQRLSTAVFTSSYQGTEYGSFALENPLSTPEKVGTFSDVYKVVFTPFNTINFATVTQYITLTVQPSDINLQLSLAGNLQVGSSLYIVTNDIPAAASDYIYYEWFRVNSPDEDYRNGVRVASGISQYTLVESDSGKYIVCVATNVDNSPYLCSAQAVTETAVQKQKLSFWQRFIKWFYKLLANLTQIFGRI